MSTQTRSYTQYTRQQRPDDERADEPRERGERSDTASIPPREGRETQSHDEMYMLIMSYLRSIDEKPVKDDGKPWKPYITAKDMLNARPMKFSTALMSEKNTEINISRTYLPEDSLIWEYPSGFCPDYKKLLGLKLSSSREKLAVRNELLGLEQSHDRQVLIHGSTRRN